MLDHATARALLHRTRPRHPRHGYPAAVRAQVVPLVADAMANGRSMSSIARGLGVSAGTLSRWQETATGRDYASALARRPRFREPHAPLGRRSVVADIADGHAVGAKHLDAEVGAGDAGVDHRELLGQRGARVAAAVGLDADHGDRGSLTRRFIEAGKLRGDFVGVHGLLQVQGRRGALGRFNPACSENLLLARLLSARSLCPGNAIGVLKKFPLKCLMGPA